MDTKIQEYKQLKLPPELHKKLKTLAIRKGQTMVQFLEELLKRP